MSMKWLWRSRCPKSAPGMRKQFCRKDFPVRKSSDNLADLLKNPGSHQGRIAVLGGQIPRRVDTPVERYFLVRDLPLGNNSHPLPSPPIRIRKPPIDTTFVLFDPSLRMMGGDKAGHGQGEKCLYRVRSPQQQDDRRWTGAPCYCRRGGPGEDPVSGCPVPDALFIARQPLHHALVPCQDRRLSAGPDEIIQEFENGRSP